MLRAFAIAGATVALAGCGTTHGTGGGAQSSTTTGSAVARCGPATAKTLAASAGARVYATSTAVYGCATTTGLRTRLGDAGFSCLGSHEIVIVRVVGEVAAYAVESCGIDTGSTTVFLRRLTDGKLLAMAPAVVAGFVEAHPTVDSLVLSPGYGAAWIAVTGRLGTTGGIEVHALDPGFKTLDSGLSIDPMSLRLSGSTVSWKHGGATRTATLP